MRIIEHVKNSLVSLPLARPEGTVRRHAPIARLLCAFAHPWWAISSGFYLEKWNSSPMSPETQGCLITLDCTSVFRLIVFIRFSCHPIVTKTPHLICLVPPPGPSAKHGYLLSVHASRENETFVPVIWAGGRWGYSQPERCVWEVINATW